ncbi:hypothetical protein BH23DEI1_BH23DEI1_02850 [soil metagenome]
MSIDESTLAAYALGTVDDAERERIERLLATDAELAAEAASLEAVLADMVMTLPPERVDEWEREALLTRVRGEAPNLSRDAPGRSAPRRASAGARHAPRRGPPLWRRPTAWVALAAVVVLALFGPRLLDDPVDREFRRYAALPEAETVALVGEDGSALGDVVQLGDGSVFVRFAAAPGVGVYQLWEITDESLESLGVVEGRAAFTRPVVPGAILGVSREGPGGSDEPTDVVALLSL